ncbi:hypothetical protein [Nocardia beijingensis]|uniref:hypothetical protein n=1 Tax=Nocardia beijingensis TaxID=95162 RepID=UPI0033AF5D0D
MNEDSESRSGSSGTKVTITGNGPTTIGDRARTLIFNFRDKAMRPWIAGSTIVTVVAVLAGFVILAPDPPASTERGPAGAASTTPPEDTLFPISPDTPCHSPTATTTQLPDVEICVAYWCVGKFHAPDGVGWIEGRGQIKLRPRIINNSAQAIDLSITPASAIRLLVATSTAPDVWWQPPPVTAAAGDKPVIVTYEGRKYWAVPPNAPRDAVKIELPGNQYTFDGFATSWYETELAPGQTAYKPLRHGPDGNAVQEGNLVFNVPVATQDVGLKGLAVVDRDDPSRVVAFVDKKDWPAPADLNSF